MRALRVHEIGGPVRLETVPDPVPADGEVLVRVEAAAIGHFDLGVAAGLAPLPQPLPYIPGMEGAGRLEDGTLVRLFGGGLGMTRPGTWAELAAVPQKAIVPMPASVLPETAAACGSSINSAWTALHEVGGLQDGESVGVVGSEGSVGSLIVQMAAGHPVHGWATPDSPDPEEPIDLLIDTLGGPGLIHRMGCVKPGGRVVQIGYIAGAKIELDLAEFILRDVSLLPLNMRRRRVAPDVAAQLLDDVANNRLNVATDVVSADEIDDAVQRLQTGRVNGRLIVRW